MGLNVLLLKHMITVDTIIELIKFVNGFNVNCNWDDKKSELYGFDI